MCVTRESKIDNLCIPKESAGGGGRSSLFSHTLQLPDERTIYQWRLPVLKSEEIEFIIYNSTALTHQLRRAEVWG